MDGQSFVIIRGIAVHYVDNEHTPIWEYCIRKVSLL